jgi:hypothetical protein
VVGKFPERSSSPLHKKMKIGVLALQGDFIEHQAIFERLG